MPLDLDVQLELTIEASPTEVQRAVLHDIKLWFVSPQNNQSMGLSIEPHVGGRLFRDLGQGLGHLWAHISVLKPGLIELVGPLANTEPCYNLLRFRFTETPTKHTKLTFTHQAIGSVSKETLEGAPLGWQMVLEKGLKPHVERHSH